MSLKGRRSEVVLPVPGCSASEAGGAVHIVGPRSALSFLLCCHHQHLLLSLCRGLPRTREVPLRGDSPVLAASSHVFLLMVLGELEKVEHLHSPWAAGSSRQLHPGREQPGSAGESGDPRQHGGHGCTEGWGGQKHQQCWAAGSPSVMRVPLCRRPQVGLSRHNAQCLHPTLGKAILGKGGEAAPWQLLSPAQNSPPLTSPFSAPGHPFSSPARHRAPFWAPCCRVAATHLGSAGRAEPSLPAAVQPGGHRLCAMCQRRAGPGGSCWERVWSRAFTSATMASLALPWLQDGLREVKGSWHPREGDKNRHRPRPQLPAGPLREGPHGHQQEGEWKLPSEAGAQG